MSTAPQLEGQEVIVRAITDGEVVAELNGVTSFNDSADQEIKQVDFLGEPFARFADVFVGYSGDFEFLVTSAAWIEWDRALTARAQRANPAITFAVVRVDNFSDGTNITHTYEDVAWGARPTSIASRGDKVKVKASFKCSVRTSEVNAFV
jgi:hypothetical protein